MLRGSGGYAEGKWRGVLILSTFNSSIPHHYNAAKVKTVVSN